MLECVKKCGGLLCFVPATMKSVRRYDLNLEFHKLEVMCINIKPTRRKAILLLVLYRPPNSNVASTTSLFDTLQQLAFGENSDMLNAGDFNIHSI